MRLFQAAFRDTETGYYHFLVCKALMSVHVLAFSCTFHCRREGLGFVEYIRPYLVNCVSVFVFLYVEVCAYRVYKFVGMCICVCAFLKEMCEEESRV